MAGSNVGHSVSFSAIKSWNVGSNVTPKSSFNESLAKPNHQDYNVSGVVEHKSEKYLDAVINSNGNKDSDAQINQNVPPPIVENQGSVFASEVTVNDDDTGQQQQQQSLNKDWNYSLLTVRNENIKVNNPSPSPSPSLSPSSSILSSSSSSTTINGANINRQRKPIFNDLLRVPYDVLNRPMMPMTESPPETIKHTQIQINHQQKFNDTITNYQHFQQFIQKTPTSSNVNHHHHYQSTAMPEQNYEIDESVSLMTNGRAHGIQTTTPKIIIEPPKNENQHSIASSSSSSSTSPLHVTNYDSHDSKFGVVYEGRDFRKYKVEEKTADGFIVGYVLICNKVNSNNKLN